MAKKKGIIQEFQEFINRGNVMDLAVGVIIGGAFTAIVNSLVSNVVQPLISFLTGGGTDIPGLSLNLNGNIVDFGALVSAVINFLITAAAVFAIVKALNKLNELKEAAEAKAAEAATRAGLVKDGEEEEPAAPRTCPFCRMEIAIDATRCPHCTSKLEGYANDAE